MGVSVGLVVTPRLTLQAGVGQWVNRLIAICEGGYYLIDGLAAPLGPVLVKTYVLVPRQCETDG